jgi:hypothetical protein
MNKTIKTTKEQTKYRQLLVDKKTVVDSWYLPYDGNPDEGVEIISDEITSRTRWSVIHTLMVRIKGTVYEAYYSSGATECQDERPWEYSDTIGFTEMVEVEKTVKVWEPVLL